MQFELLTSKNIGAISVFSLKGNEDEIADFLTRFWRVKHSGALKRVKAVDVNQIIYGFFVQKDEIVDEALLIGISKGTLELHVHGGFGVVERVTRILISEGFVQAENSSNEITQLFVNARTDKEAKLILAQSKLLKIKTQEINERLEQSDFEGVNKIADEILSNRKVYENLKNPPVVFLLGKPNVGKSTLFNQLAGFERVITSDESGTTRDVVSQVVNIFGWSVKLSDAAGVRKTDNYIEKRSVVRSLRKVREAGLIIFITDLSTELTEEERQIIAELEKLQHIKVANKADVDDRKANSLDAIEISAKTSAGVVKLKRLIVEKLGFVELNENSPLPISPLSCEFLKNLKTQTASENICEICELLDNISKSFDINVI